MRPAKICVQAMLLAICFMHQAATAGEVRMPGIPREQAPADASASMASRRTKLM